MENRITRLFSQKKNNILSIYFTAGYPNLNNTVSIITELEKNGVDLIEIGIPFSDPLADGPTIQQSSEVALENGMSLKVLFKQIENIRQHVNIPLVLMGYLNPVLRFGMENFLKECGRIGIDGLILPDLPMKEYNEHYKPLFEKHKLSNIFLITPQSAEERIKEIDSVSDGFIYMVSSSATTGKNSDLEDSKEYFNRVNNLRLKNPLMIGFGISSGKALSSAFKYANGAIIGSAFIKALTKEGSIKQKVEQFLDQIRIKA